MGGYSYNSYDRATFNPNYWKERKIQKEKKEKERIENVDETMKWIYYHFRNTQSTLEKLTDDCEIVFSPKELKRLDKAVTIIKFGFKLIKFVINQREKRMLKQINSKPMLDMRH